MEAAAAAAAAAIQQQPPVPAVPQAFARFPGSFNPNAILNFGNAQDRKAYNKAVEWTEEKFDLSSDKLFGYGQRELTHCIIHGLIPVIMVPHLAPGAVIAIALNFIETYGIIPMAECRAHSTAILAVQDRMNLQCPPKFPYTGGPCDH
jgi:hypothetical protein